MSAWPGLILLFPALATVLCGLCMALRLRNKLPGWITVVCLGASFVVTLALYLKAQSLEGAQVVHLFDWFNLHWNRDGVGGVFVAGFGLYLDKLTLLWMLFVTGIGTLIALYSTEYMEADVGRGYGRFFAGVSIFLLAMSALVMADNLIMMYLGWEGVGFASYWLIGYYYRRPSAVAAAKKAFIVNRIGDLGLALGIWLTYHNFGTVEYATLFRAIESGAYAREAGGWSIEAIPYLFMLGAFGKSAQIPLFVWLPDAMEGPTPVSALIHAATMVTAGVFLLCRMFPVMELHAAALPTVAWVGGLTALLAATIGMAQYDMKRIWAYSTVSQLGFMFLGIGVLSTAGAAYHVFTHAFFKAVLFLSAGAVMHGFAGQLDVRKISGLRHMQGWRITSWTMLVGCLCLAGFPLTSGFFSKDAILAQAFATHGPGFAALGWIALITAGLTAYYTFRVWFRVCAGPVSYELGDEHHGEEEDAGHGPPGAHAAPGAHGGPGAHGAHGAHGQPHAPRLAINVVLLVIALGALLAALPIPPGKWIAHLLGDSSAAGGVPHDETGAAHGTLFGADPHTLMYFLSAGIGLAGIFVAWRLHLANRAGADALKQRLLASPATRWLPLAMENKWYVDEVYHALLRLPLWIWAHALNLLDRYLVDGLLIDGVARVPRLFGRWFQPLQNGILQSYAVSMAGLAGLMAVLVLNMPAIIAFVRRLAGGEQ